MGGLAWVADPLDKYSLVNAVDNRWPLRYLTGRRKRKGKRIEVLRSFNKRSTSSGTHFLPGSCSICQSALILPSFREHPHPNVVLFMGECNDNGVLMLVTELLPRGNLANLLKDHRIPLSMPTRIRMARGAALGMNW